MSGAGLETALAGYLRAQMPQAEDLRVDDLTRFHGGASRETYRFVLHWREGGEARRRTLILRRDPEASLIDTDRRIEFAAYRTFHGTDVPVPEALWLEMGDGALGSPFFIMSEVPEGAAASPFNDNPYGEHREKVGEAFWRILGRVHAREAEAAPLAQVADHPDPAQCWRRELDHWEAELDRDELEPQPIVRAAIRRLRRVPPPPPERLRIVHGDFRTGNVLTDEAGGITAVLDWEMAHLGDPHEDLAWAMDPLWAHNDPARPGGMIETERALTIWETASGLKVNREALAWWRLFASVKGMVIWISSAKEFVSGANTDPILAFSARYCGGRQNQILLDLMGH
ncbi:MAG: phosphotransferase family protein [Alphaproteobacteria bacterium]